MWHSCVPKHHVGQLRQMLSLVKLASFDKLRPTQDPEFGKASSKCEGEYLYSTAHKLWRCSLPHYNTSASARRLTRGNQRTVNKFYEAHAQCTNLKHM